MCVVKTFVIFLILSFRNYEKLPTRSTISRTLMLLALPYSSLCMHPHSTTQPPPPHTCKTQTVQTYWKMGHEWMVLFSWVNPPNFICTLLLIDQEANVFQNVLQLYNNNKNRCYWKVAKFFCRLKFRMDYWNVPISLTSWGHWMANSSVGHYWNV